MASPAEEVFTLMAASIRAVIALLVSLMAASEWMRTRSETFLHLRTAFLVSFGQQTLRLGATAGAMALQLPAIAHLPVVDHALETLFLLTLCHAMAVHDTRRRTLVHRVTLRLAWITAAAAVMVIWRPPRWELGWEAVMALLLLLSIYLTVLLRPSIFVVRSLVILLSGTGAHLLNLAVWGGEAMVLRVAEQFLPAAGAASFLWAVHSGIVRETYTDALTRIHNKRFFLDRLPEEMERAERRERPLSLLVLDLDHFKRFNDTHGHVEGDRLLQSVAAILNRHVRRYDLVCRWGGEEFALMLPDTDVETAIAVAERLRRAVAAGHGGPEQKAPVTVSVGVAAFPDGAAGPEQLLQAADTALYKAKEQRNRVAVWQPS